MSVWKGELLIVALVALLLAVGSVVAALNESDSANGMAADSTVNPSDTQVSDHLVNTSG